MQRTRFLKTEVLLSMEPYPIQRLGEICNIQLQPHAGQKTVRAIDVFNGVVAPLWVGWGGRGCWGDSGGHGCGGHGNISRTNGLCMQVPTNSTHC